MLGVFMSLDLLIFFVFWEVGLVCGIIYNLWMRRTRSLGDLMLTHATTNLALSLYVIGTHRWMYWM